ncbi:USP7 family protein [Megaselia abdita]
MDTDGTENHQTIELMDTQETDMLDSNMTTGTEDATMQQESNQMDATAVPDSNAENIEDEVRSEATFDFKIPNFSKLKDSTLSPPVMVRNLPWKIMALQRNERNSTESKSLGFFLQCNGESDLTNWSCNAVAELRLKSWIPGQEAFCRKIKHVFYSKENDWGFSYFIGWNEIMDPEKGYIKDDTIVLEVHVVAEAPHGVFWDSKKHTGYVGLKNQGATCYMNSLLQTLCFTNQLRKAVYKMPTEADDSTKSVGLALQRVFHDLQFMDKPVGTKKLTKSFGWETLDSFMQHDVQEFLRVLLDKLESKMKGTCVEGTVPHLFEGKMKSYIKCKNVDCTSNRLETFYDIQLNIKGKKNIYESFQDYIAAETLEGDNKYDAGVHGLQDAEKGVIFKSFPPVLHLHLMRFQYDPITDSSVKFNDRFEFLEQINLDPYLDQKDPKNPAIYKLHAVLVHSGDNHGGHYVVYINPMADGRWCKFDDDVVSSCSKMEAIEHNYGGVDDEMAINAKHCSNAYMLVYIRTSEIPMVLEQITPSDIPVELTQRLNEEKRLEVARRKERTEANLMIHIHVILEEVFESHASPELFDFEHSNYHQIRMKKSQTVEELLGTLSQTFKVAQNRMRIWPLVPHRNQGQKFAHFDANEDLHKQLINVDSPWYIYVEMLCPDVGGLLPSFDRKRDVFMFFKFYDPIKKCLTYLGHGQYQLATRVCDLIPHINKSLGFEATTELSVYEECPSNSVQKIINMNDTLDKVLTQLSRDNSIQGVILIFEKKIALNNSDSVDGFISNQQNVVVHPQFNHLKLELPTVDHYFRDLLHRVEILFVDKTVVNDPGFTLEISNRLSCTQMAQAVAEKINTDPNRIQFFKCVG